jgi:hypothetical protein
MRYLESRLRNVNAGKEERASERSTHSSSLESSLEGLEGAAVLCLYLRMRARMRFFTRGPFTSS